MSFGTPSRVQALRKEYEKSLRGLSSAGSEKNKSFYEDSLDGNDDDEIFAAFSGKKNLSQSGRTSPSPSGRSSPSAGTSPRGAGRGVYRASYSTAALDDGEKDRLIAELQGEVARLREKINTVVESAEGSLQEAIEAQDALRDNFQSRISKKDLETERIRIENAVLKDMINKLQLDLAHEREQVSKGLRFMDRVKSAGNERFKSLLDKNIFKNHVKGY
jgi:hypothetical protein